MIAVETISNNFGIPYLTSSHHAIGVRFKVTGGSGSYQYRRNINNTPSDETSWQGWTDVLPDNYTGVNNKHGYPIDTFWWWSTVPVEVRDKNNPTDIWKNHLFQFFYNNVLTALPMGDTPFIVNNSLASGGTSITVKTRKINSFVRLFKSTYSGDGNGGMGQNFQPLSEPIATGISDNNGDITFTVPPMVTGERYCCTAQSFNDFESLVTNYIEVGGPKKVNLQVTVTYGNKTATGRPCTVTSVTGGSGTYAIGLLNNDVFDKVVGTPFEIPFSLSNIFVKDTASNDLHVSVAVDGGANTSGVSYYGSLRERFGAGTNPNGAVKFGMKLADNSFALLDHFGTHNSRESWGKSGYRFPFIGIDDAGLSTNRILMHPAGNVGGTDDFEKLAKACARYTVQASGTMNINGNSVRPTRTDNPWSTPPKTNLDSRFQILHNNVVVYSYIHTTQNYVETFSIDLNVTSQDTVDFVVDSYDVDLDEGDNSFDHVHVDAGWALTSNANGLTPPKPTLTTELGDVPVILPPIALGSKIKGIGNLNTDYVIMYLNGFPETIARNTDTGFLLDGAMRGGKWTARTSRNKLLSDASNEVTVQNVVTVPPSPPQPSSTTVFFGTPITGVNNQDGFLRTYKANSTDIYSQLPVIGTTNAWSFNAPEIGTYRFKAVNIYGQISEFSSVVNVIAPTQNGITLFVESEIFGACIGEEFEYSFSETITDVNSTSLVWSNTIVLPANSSYRFFARLLNDHSVNYTSSLINSTLFSTENWYNVQ